MSESPFVAGAQAGEFDSGLADTGPQLSDAGVERLCQSWRDPLDIDRARLNVVVRDVRDGLRGRNAQRDRLIIDLLVCQDAKPDDVIAALQQRKPQADARAEVEFVIPRPATVAGRVTELRRQIRARYVTHQPGRAPVRSRTPDLHRRTVAEIAGLRPDDVVDPKRYFAAVTAAVGEEPSPAGRDAVALYYLAAPGLAVPDDVRVSGAAPSGNAAAVSEPAAPDRLDPLVPRKWPRQYEIARAVGLPPDTVGGTLRRAQAAIARRYRSGPQPGSSGPST